MLSTIARSEPHAAYAGFVTGFQHKLHYFMRVMQNICNLFPPLNEVLDTEFIPAQTDGHNCSKEERLFLSLPSKQGGLAIPILFERSKVRLLKLPHSMQSTNQSHVIKLSLSVYV